MAQLTDPISFTPEHFLWSYRDGIATITLNIPQKKNPLTFESYAELRDCFNALQSTDVKIVIITGADGNFCSGGDVHDIIGPLVEMDSNGLLAFTQMTGDLVKAMRHCPQPIIAAVDGVCAGAGAILAMASDIRIGTPGCKTAFLFTRVGLAGCDMGVIKLADAAIATAAWSRWRPRCSRYRAVRPVRRNSRGAHRSSPGRTDPGLRTGP